MISMKRTLSVLLATAAAALAQIPDFTPPSPLFGAVLTNNTEAVQRLLDSGVNPNEGRFIGGRPALHFALIQNNKEMVSAMIAKGADINAADASGSTPLMIAAYNDAGDPSIVEGLLLLGADPNHKNNKGETALTWALRRGYTPVVEVLKKAGASDTEMIRQSVEKAIGLLQKSGPQFVKVSGCTSCHNQSLPQMAYSAARARGFAVDAASAEYNVKAVAAMFRPVMADMAAGKPNIPNPPISVSYGLLGMAAENYPANDMTEAAAHLVATQQRPDGSFIVLPGRPPLEASAFTGTALSLRALQIYGKDEDVALKVAKARAWLGAARPLTNEDRSMQLLGLAWGDAGVETLRKSAQALLSQQKADGGWSQLDSVETDAYATGQAMVALMTAGQITTEDKAWQRGVAYLLRTQLEDGSWLVRSRSFPFQPYKESGFPHGKNQWISAAGTSWAVWALSLGQPVKSPESSRVTNAM